MLDEHYVAQQTFVHHIIASVCFGMLWFGLAWMLYLLPALYERYNPMNYEDARSMEVELGIALRKAGYGVWQA